MRDGDHGKSMKGFQSAGEMSFQPVTGQKEINRLAQKRRIAEDASQRKKSAERKRALDRSAEVRRRGRDDDALALAAVENPPIAREAPRRATPSTLWMSAEEHVQAGPTRGRRANFPTRGG